MMHQRKFRALFLLLTFLCFNQASAQLDSAQLFPRLKKHISTLASDEFGGREPGTRGEELARNYIIREYEAIGLLPGGSKGYLQPFTFTRALKTSPESKLVINGTSFPPDAGFYPLAYSANAAARGTTVAVGYGLNVPDRQYNDYKDKPDLSGKIFVIDISTPDKGGPHSKYAEFADLRSRIDTAIAKGAAAVIFTTADPDMQEPVLNAKIKVTPSRIPVLYVERAKNAALLNTSGAQVDLTAAILREEATGHNVIGFIDNKAENTVIIGAHYDHLGHGGEESLYRGEPAVHNGADDNASGVAGVIELARYIKANGPTRNNYLFMAFSGEEKGLLGSGFYTKNPLVDLKKVNYMLNMDMIGRLKPEDPVLIINGAGTSDAWKITMNYITVDGLKIKTTESGVGPSDHTSFYLKDIPVLHFFSGTHSDYHKPSDDEALINYGGEWRILNYMTQLMQRLDDKGKLAFIKTKDADNAESPRFKVTLGVVPDYGFEGKGMRIDGVSEGKPAQKAGLKQGDVVTRIGDIPVTDMMSYMKALGKFNKGEKTMVVVVRGREEVRTEVEF